MTNTNHEKVHIATQWWAHHQLLITMLNQVHFNVAAAGMIVGTYVVNEMNESLHRHLIDWTGYKARQNDRN